MKSGHGFVYVISHAQSRMHARNPYHNVWGECARNFLNVQEFLAKMYEISSTLLENYICVCYVFNIPLNKENLWIMRKNCCPNLLLLGGTTVLVTIENENYSTAVYDKRDNFNFNIVI